MDNTTSSYTLSSWEPASSGPCPTSNNLTSPSDDNRFCPSVFDEFLCWPVTKVGERVYLPCPQNIRGLDPTKSVYRDCLAGGRWFSCGGDADNGVGWTNYTQCWSKTTMKLMEGLNAHNCPSNATDNHRENKLFIAHLTRIFEMVGYSISLIVLIFALTTFCYFRKLRKPRVTRIHMNLFASMILQVFIRLVIYADQFVVWPAVWSNVVSEHDNMTTSVTQTTSSPPLQVDTVRVVWGIDNTPFLCQTFYTLIEYGKTTMFLWMFIEGIILHHMTTVAYSRGPDNQLTFYLCGWLMPIPLTIAWLVTKMYEQEADSKYCGQGYTFLSSYWILEGPRIAAVMLNIFILFNVMCVLFTHISGNETSDIKQIRKSLKSLFFLLPLLGVTNVLHFLWPNPLKGSVLSFAVWSFTTHFLYSFQGVFVASVYFLFDDKVKDTLYKFWVLKVRLRSTDNINGNGGRVFEHDNTVFRSSEGTKVKAAPLPNGNRSLKPNTGRGLRPDLGDSLRSSPRTDSASVKPGLTPKRGATLRRINTQRGNSPHPKSNSHIFSTINLVLARIKGGARVKSEADSKEHLQMTGASSSPNNDLNNFDSPLCRPDECTTPQLPPPPAKSADIELSTQVPESAAAGAGNYTSVTVHQQITPRRSDPITVVNSKGPTGGGGGGDTKITVDVVVDFKGIRICDHHHSKETD